MSEQGYVNYFEILGLPEDCKPGEVRKNYRKQMKDLVMEIARVEITEEKRDTYLLDMARLNAAYFILRDNKNRERYVEDRQNVIRLEEEWREAANQDEDTAEPLRRAFDGAVKHFLARYMEELMLEAGRDPECVEESHWDAAHERHAGRVLRHYRQQLYQEIHERLPYHQITEPKIDWEERKRFARAVLSAEAH